jgi:hypothetical protein
MPSPGCRIASRSVRIMRWSRYRKHRAAGRTTSTSNRRDFNSMRFDSAACTSCASVAVPIALPSPPVSASLTPVTASKSLRMTCSSW